MKLQNNNFITSMKVMMTARPEPGLTQTQPFQAGIGGCGNFRIPAIVATESGALIAACDARWDHHHDCGGLDTLVSVSKDDGSSWEYQFANYLGDNGNTYHDHSVSFIDPALGTDGKTIYMIVGLMQAGFAGNYAPYRFVPGQNGLDDKGNLRLRLLWEDYAPIGTPEYRDAAANGRYGFYLDNTDGRIYEYASGESVEDYSVDPWFFITCPDGTVTNLFAADSPFQPYPVHHLYLTTSSDEGATWSHPQLLNLKQPAELGVAIGPGSGVYHAENRHMIFSAYAGTETQPASSILIWMDENGVWHRSKDSVGIYSTEASAVVLSDGTVRVFFRDDSPELHYADFVWDGTGYLRSGQVMSAGVSKTIENQLSAIRYSKKHGEKDVLILSMANGGEKKRKNGVIYTFTVEKDGTMTLLNTYHVTPGGFSYSCLAERSDGDLALLYESEHMEITYCTIPAAAVFPDTASAQVSVTRV